MNRNQLATILGVLALSVSLGAGESFAEGTASADTKAGTEKPNEEGQTPVKAKKADKTAAKKARAANPGK